MPDASRQTFRLEPFWRVILRDLDLAGEAVARRAGLPANLFASDPVMVDIEGWAALWDALDATVAEPDLALRLGRVLTLDMFDPAHFAVFCSEHLHQAATRLQRYKRLLGPTRLAIDDQEALALTCSVAGLSLPPVLYGTGELVVWVAMARHATRHHVIPRRVVMPFEPNGQAGFEAYFGVPVTRGANFELVFEADDARRRFLATDASMWSFFEPTLDRRLAELDVHTSMAERVGAALYELLPSGRRQVGDVARAVGSSPRTIQRRLGDEGTTFRAVLDETRAQLAQHYLTRTGLSNSQAAFLLGYDDPNSFYPAFRRWTGMTPQAARAARVPLRD
ncbi:MAG: helix-turn-helix domain-containing protein [Acidimicrobiia bacterium]|nr:helix-turn-helix domain-containing protein [Acidimicrobiia bacterium]